MNKTLLLLHRFCFYATIFSTDITNREIAMRRILVLVLVFAHLFGLIGGFACLALPDSDPILPLLLVLLGWVSEGKLHSLATKGNRIAKDSGVGGQDDIDMSFYLPTVLLLVMLTAIMAFVVQSFELVLAVITASLLLALPPWTKRWGTLALLWATHKEEDGTPR